MTKKKSKIVGSTKPYTNPKYLKGKDKIKKAGRILGGSAKIPKPLDKKFVGCSVEHGLENWLLEEYKNFGSDKAGFIPYFKDNKGVIRMLFVKSSNPAYGGDKFMIAKGQMEPNENPRDAALREGKEECGLKPDNLKPESIRLAWQGKISGLVDTASMSIYIGEVIDPINFSATDFEVSETKWMTLEQFQSSGRGSHRQIVEICAKAISN